MDASIWLHLAPRKSPLAPLVKQGGFIQEKENVNTHLLSPQPPSNEFGANSQSSLK
jgi:hypothetical protein